jgi:Ras-related protein Rab-18
MGELSDHSVPLVEAPRPAGPVGLKIAICGATLAGKSALVGRLTTGAYTAPDSPTIGAAFFKKDLDIAGGRTVTLDLWDTAGNTKMRSLLKMYVERAAGTLIVFNVTNRRTFDDLPGIIDMIKQHSPADMPIILLGNFVDAEWSREVTAEEAAALAASVGADYWEACPTTGRNVDAVFRALAGRALERIDPDVAALLTVGGEAKAPWPVRAWCCVVS